MHAPSHSQFRLSTDRLLIQIVSRRSDMVAGVFFSDCLSCGGFYSAVSLPTGTNFSALYPAAVASIAPDAPLHRSYATVYFFKIIVHLHDYTANPSSFHTSFPIFSTTMCRGAPCIRLMSSYAWEFFVHGTKPPRRGGPGLDPMTDDAIPRTPTKFHQTGTLPCGSSGLFHTDQMQNDVYIFYYLCTRQDSSSL